MEMISPSDSIRIVEVGPRDGLQNEKNVIPTEAKIRFIDALSQTGLTEIEVGAFVRPGRIPQMADTLELFGKIKRKTGVIYSTLVPNEQGLDRAIEAKADKIAVFTAASETFNHENINASIAESIERFKPVILKAKAAKLPVRAYVSTAFWCPYEGQVKPAKVAEVSERLLGLGIDELSIGDTIGKASPDEVRRLLDLLLPKVRRDILFLHFHDTYGKAAANALYAWQEFGVTGFDASAGGLGGCPYAPGASGNVATEDLLSAFRVAGASIPVDPQTVAAAAAILAPYIGRTLTSRLNQLQ